MLQSDGHPYIPRGLRRSLLAALADTPVVCLLGARQSGKSTLARHLAPDRTFINLDDAAYLAVARRDPQGFLAELPDFVTIDEIQRVPELTLAIKRSVDNDRRPGRFLLTGSANLLQLPRLADSLAGRMECIYLQPLSESEKEQAPGQFLDDWLEGRITPKISGSRAPERSSLPQRLLAGGYPEACRRPPGRARNWLRQYVHSIIERDIRDIARLRDGSDLARLIELLSQRTATLLNVANLATTLGCARLTVERHLGLLERLFLVRRLPAWHRNEGKRLIKAPKIHLCDSGLAAALAHLDATMWLAERPRFGHLLESFIVQQLVSQAGWSHPECRFWHYRDKDQIEVDCVISKGNRVWGIEIKLSQSVSAADTKGLERLSGLTHNDFQAGLVFYDGVDVLSLGREDFLAVPISKLWKL